MRDLGVTEIVIVIGHLGHHVVQALGDGRALGVKLSYVEQDQVLGIAHAVSQLDPYITRPFLLFLGDIFFETENLASMLELYRGEGVDAVLAVKVEEDKAALRRNFTVDLDEQGARAPRDREAAPPEHQPQGLRPLPVRHHDLRCRAAHAAHRPARRVRAHRLDPDLHRARLRGGPARVVLDDLNLSGPEDLLALNLHVMRKAGHARYVAEDAELASGAEVRGVVVMARARIEAGAVLRRCLVCRARPCAPAATTTRSSPAGSSCPAGGSAPRARPLGRLGP
jgi:hypothetical protein